MIRSKYEEDVHPNNHTSVWGSYWQGGHWGYKCCHSFVKNSYCTGDAGKNATEIPILGSGTTEPCDKEEEEIAEPETRERTVVENINKEDGEKSNDSSADEKDSSESSEDEDTWKSKTERKSKSKKKKNKKRKQKEKRRNKKLNKDAEDKLKEALKKEVENQKEADRLLKMDERKRPYNSMFEVKEPTAEEIEAFQMKRKREEDPMAHFLNN